LRHRLVGKSAVIIAGSSEPTETASVYSLVDQDSWACMRNSIRHGLGLQA
jgi:hypothetical protein